MSAPSPTSSPTAPRPDEVIMAGVHAFQERAGLFDRGAIAMLRRMSPRQGPWPGVFWSFITRPDFAGWTEGRGAENAWAVLLAGMAEMAPLIHERGTGLGTALRGPREGGGYSEPRLLRLLRADRPDAFAYEFAAATRWCASHRRPFDWVQTAPLVFGRMAGRLDADNAARRIARDYFRPFGKGGSEPDTATDLPEGIAP
ncbi:conserved protein of unknown function [Rhodovastum atsumiense]|uniref:Type I-E CRISPR-associated protein Cse2/CasB n=1 Tax=Rhodovastum atsumiense TaxID=504468 RepID=A0A5M6INJ7_9PROT|nr:type I-E CRISPR-associated protein Cse2/CasB [Rhodovastum atsumiense]KAA5609834.1 hypothetical protein F1189_22350 [Rhodovastum atsumiense]CAH2603747.1 conserved protein of unknown function [Rhodovastum atsumiense]